MVMKFVLKHDSPLSKQQVALKQNFSRPLPYFYRPHNNNYSGFYDFIISQIFLLSIVLIVMMSPSQLFIVKVVAFVSI